jgi:hypothetical protein
MRTKRELFEEAKTGKTHCDLCERDLHNVKTPFGRQMAKAITEFYQAAGSGWFRFTPAPDNAFYRKLLGWNFTKLMCWGLIESKLVDPTKNHKKWRLTPLGLDFVRGRVGIPSYVFIPTGTMNTPYGKPFGPTIMMSKILP